MESVPVEISPYSLYKQAHLARINQLPKEKLVSPLDNQRGAILYYIG